MKSQQRGFASMLISLSFLVATVSGIILYVAPRGRTASWTNWSILGLDRYEWTALHINMSALLLIIAGVHLCLNWTVFRSYMKKMATRGMQLKQETLLAVLFTLLVIGGSVYDTPPFSTITRRRYDFKIYWDQKAAIEAASDPTANDNGWNRNLNERRSSRENSSVVNERLP